MYNPVHLLPSKGQRETTGARSRPLREEIHPDVRGRNRIETLPTWLAVETSARYQPEERTNANGRRSTATFCNIYAHDFAYQLGLYIPRVFWYDRVWEAIQAGQPAPEPKWGKTVREMSANALAHWFKTKASDFGWNLVTCSGNRDQIKQGIEDLQALVSFDKGLRIGTIVAKKRPRQGSGHITIVLPESEIMEGWEAKRQKGRVVEPLQSQAGSHNCQLFTSDWYLGSRFEYVVLAWAEVPEPYC